MLDLHDINGRAAPDTVRSYVLPDMLHQALGNQSICPIDRRPCTHGQLRRMDGLSLRIWSGIQVKCGCHDLAALGGGQLQTPVLICIIAPSEVVEIISREEQ